MSENNPPKKFHHELVDDDQNEIVIHKFVVYCSNMYHAVKQPAKSLAELINPLAALDEPHKEHFGLVTNVISGNLNEDAVFKGKKPYRKIILNPSQQTNI